MKNPVLLFDGVCNFCDSTINFVIEREGKKNFKYASLQSEPGQELLKKHGLPTSDFDSFVYIENGKAFTKSSAASESSAKYDWIMVIILWLHDCPQIPPRCSLYTNCQQSLQVVWEKRRMCITLARSERKVFGLTQFSIDSSSLRNSDMLEALSKVLLGRRTYEMDVKSVS